MSDFVHLRLHSEFSISDGILTLNQAIKQAKANNMQALAITDINNGFAWIKFYQQAKKQGIKPILGCDLSIENERLLCLIQNNNGYLNLCKILSHSWKSGEIKLTKQDLIEISPNLEGLIFLSGGQHSNVYQMLLQNNIQKARSELEYWYKILGDRFYLELQYNQDSHIIWSPAINLCKKINIPIVATHPIQFLQAEDFQAHEVRICVSASDTLANPQRKKLFNSEQYFKSSQQMQEMFKFLPSAIQNTLEIAKRCNVELTLGKPQLPNFITPDNLSLDEFLYKISYEGLEKRLIKTNTQQINSEQKHIYIDRLKFEIETIIHMGFAGYFLIVADFINWAKNNDIPVGPGRGSGAGSLVAYVLGITDIDPLPYNLLFERFLNPERVSMPDFDIDFCQHGRDKVIQYVKEKYGFDAVSQIATFGTMAAKAAVRDVGRVLDLGYNFVDGIAKLIPFKPTKHVTIASSLEEEPLLRERFNNEEEVRQLLELAQKLEGITRNVGMHAGGVLIAPNKLTDFCPLYSQDGTSVISQYDKDDVENVGLVKFDFLGLTTLTILNMAQKNVQNLIDKNFNYTDINTKDKSPFEILKTANTVAVFQLESRGMQSMLKDARPDRFEDIIALVSLYRPGPMDLIPSYIARKHGREQVIYPDIRVEPILKETYGIMVYQEQVMQMAQIIGNYTLGGADLLRRAMGKKKPEEMAEHRKIFSDGASLNNVNQEKANEIFDLMEKFAGYGFNKSHATAYALLAYYTAWFKANHIACFMAANLSLAMDDSDKTALLLSDCKHNKIKILPPDIHISNYTFTPIKDEQTQKINIIYGLGAIKGLGKNAIEYIIMERKQGNFTSFFNFAERMDKKIINKRALEALIKSGAFDCFNENRGTLCANIDKAIELSNQILDRQNQSSLFDNMQDAAPLPQLIQQEWDINTILKQEKSVLGLFFSGHLFDSYKSIASPLIQKNIFNIETGKDKVVVGIISSLRVQMTNREKMLILTIDDGTATLECVVFAKVLEIANTYLKEDVCIWIKGEIKFDNFNQTLRINANQIYSLEQALYNLAKNITLYITYPSPLPSKELINKLNENLTTSIRIYYSNSQGKYNYKIVLPNSYKCDLSDDFIKHLNLLNIKYTINY